MDSADAASRTPVDTGLGGAADSPHEAKAAFRATYTPKPLRRSAQNFRQELPNERNEGVADLLDVFRIAPQIFTNDFFLIKKPPQKHGHKKYNEAK